MPLLAPVTRTALEAVCSLACAWAWAHSNVASNALVVIRSTRMAASLLHSAPATTLPKSSLSLVPATGRTQTAYCIGPAIRCMTTRSHSDPDKLQASGRSGLDEDRGSVRQRLRDMDEL